MKRIAIIALVAVVCGCSAPTQRVAETALTIQNRQNATIHDDILAIAKQQTLELAGRDAAEAAQRGDVAAAQAVVEKLATTWDTLSWLDREHAKTRYGPTGIVAQYVWQQQGIFDILAREWQEARAATLPAD